MIYYQHCFYGLPFTYTHKHTHITFIQSFSHILHRYMVEKKNRQKEKKTNEMYVSSSKERVKKPSDTLAAPACPPIQSHRRYAKYTLLNNGQSISIFIKSQHLSHTHRSHIISCYYSSLFCVIYLLNRYIPVN